MTPTPEALTPETLPEPATEHRTRARIGRWIRGPLIRRGSKTIGLILLFFVAYVWVRSLADPYGHLSIDPGVIFAAALVGAGVLLLRGQQPVYEEEADAVPAEPKKRSPLGVLTLSVAFLVVGVMILLGNLDIAEITMGHMAAAGLFVVGLGLLVGSWWGRSRFLIVVGVLMVPIVVAGGFMHFPLRGAIGDRWINTRSIDSVETHHEILVGSFHLNLADLESFEGDREIDIKMAAGRADIFVPARIGLTINGHIEYGAASIGRGRQLGDDLVLTNEIEGKPDAGHLTINFTGGITALYVERITFAQLHGPLPGTPEARRQQRQRERRREQRAEQRKERRIEQRQKERRRERAETRD